jgi:hypothetical protein
MALPTRAMCPICRRGIAWFYGTKQFAAHKDTRTLEWCEGNNLIGHQKGAAPYASGNRLSMLKADGTFEPFVILGEQA